MKTEWTGKNQSKEQRCWLVGWFYGMSTFVRKEQRIRKSNNNEGKNKWNTKWKKVKGKLKESTENKNNWLKRTKHYKIAGKKQFLSPVDFINSFILNLVLLP